jgi:peptide chain release factor 2
MQDHLEMHELLQEEQDITQRDPFLQALLQYEKNLSLFEIKTKLNGKMDPCDAIVNVNAGAGGTESCDWASMLIRMYQHWAEDHKFKVEVVDVLEGEEAGIKNCTFIVRGKYAYGYLKAESGVHRLVRISPFDSNKRRHTSFASIDISAEVSDDIDVDIKENELKIDTYRSSGAGGQHVNVTDSAVRITHIPSGIIVSCQSERSQYKNKTTAMKILKSRIYDRILKEREAESKKEYAEKQDIGWGSQIRSYVFAPYQLVKDHRTKASTGNVQAVMDGDIDLFIETFLKAKGKPMGQASEDEED